MVRLLLQHGARVNSPTVTDCRRCNRPVPSPIHSCVPPLYIAAETSSRDVVRVLLEHGADPNLISEDGNVPLHLAVRNNWDFDGDVMRALIRVSNVNCCDCQDARTPLHYAAWENNTHAAEVLLEAEGIDVNAQDLRWRHHYTWRCKKETTKWQLCSSGLRELTSILGMTGEIGRCTKRIDLSRGERRD